MSTENGPAPGTLMLAFLAGAAAGAAVALLYAPAAGTETRGRLTDKARESRDRAAEAASKGREAVTRGRQTVVTAIERGREAYEQARSGVAPPREGA